MSILFRTEDVKLEDVVAFSEPDKLPGSDNDTEGKETKKEAPAAVEETAPEEKPADEEKPAAGEKPEHVLTEAEKKENAEMTDWIRTDEGVDDTPDIYEDPLEPKRRAALAHRHAGVAAIDNGEDEAAFNELVKAVDVYEEVYMLGANEQDAYVLGKTCSALQKLAFRLNNRYTEMSAEAYRNMAAVTDEPELKQGFFREANDCQDKAKRYMMASQKYGQKVKQYI